MRDKETTCRPGGGREPIMHRHLTPPANWAPAFAGETVFFASHKFINASIGGPPRPKMAGNARQCWYLAFLCYGWTA